MSFQNETSALAVVPIGVAIQAVVLTMQGLIGNEVSGVVSGSRLNNQAIADIVAARFQKRIAEQVGASL